MGKLLRILGLAAVFATITIGGCSVIEQTFDFLTPQRECPALFVPIDFQDERICVMQDYYSVDGVRTPLGYNDALEIAQTNGWSLPTPEIVDAVWEQADCRLEPISMPPGPDMTSPEYALRHNSLIEEQLWHSDNYEYCNIIAGHKKDVVAAQQPGRVTIYGWHRANGEPIQPVSSIHDDDYADYSHGVRFIIRNSNE